MTSQIISSESMRTHCLTCFPPVIETDTRILIIGSFPGKASLEAQQYYAHPRNQFWRLISAITGASIVGLPYEARLAHLLAHDIGMWDVFFSCERHGSLDTAIRNPQLNDFDALRHQYPTLARVCFNGKLSGKFAPRFATAGFEALVLPSSSPANAQWSFEQKLTAWRQILE